MKAPNWFIKELKLMNSELYPFYFDRYRKWMIVRNFPRRVGGVTDYDPISGKNFVVEMVIEDERHNPLPLDRDVLFAVRICLYDRHSRPFSYYYQRVKEREERRRRQAIVERSLRFKDAAKDIHKFMTSETFVLGR
jgi:hypothetical protein